jgi:hypothetical protein
MAAAWLRNTVRQLIDSAQIIDRARGIGRKEPANLIRFRDRPVDRDAPIGVEGSGKGGPMPHAVRTAIHALALLALSLAVFAGAYAQAPGSRYGFCYGMAGNPRVNNFTPVFAVGSVNQQGPAGSDFLRHMHERYGGYITQELACQFYATQGEAARERSRLMDEARNYPAWPVVEIDWTPSLPAPATPKPPAPVAAPPASPAPPVAAAKPPAKPVTAPVQAGVFVICRSEWNTDLRRFYNPPVDGRGAGYAEWQASYGQYLASHHNFKGSNFGCGKYPTREAAQADYDSWVANARATPSVNGRPSPIIITDWKY